MPSDTDPVLAAALGNVALADAEADEWLVFVLSAILQPLTVNSVRSLVGSDSASQKIAKIKDLLRQRGYEHTGVGDPHEPIEEIGRRSMDQKRRRDLALHSYYGRAEGDTFPRFRSRSETTQGITVDELNILAAEIRATTDQWAAVVRQLEHQAGESGSGMALVGGLLEDCREILTVRRFSEQDVRAARAEGSLRLALKGYGRWRPLADGETPAADEHLATLGPTGEITLVLSTGDTVSGGDTGWRDITDLAAAADPEVRLAAIRRIHGQVLFTQEGGALLEIEQTPDTLQARIFNEGQLRVVDLLPPYMTDLEGFRPE